MTIFPTKKLKDAQQKMKFDVFLKCKTNYNQIYIFFTYLKNTDQS
jgi:hypothetical protein